MLRHHRAAPRRGDSHRPRAGRGVAGLTPRRLAERFLVLLALVVAAAALYNYAPSRARSRRPDEEGRRQILPGGVPPRITIFSDPRPPPEGSPERQELAVRSWLALPVNVSVVLLGASPAATALAARLGRRVTVVAAVDSAYALSNALLTALSYA